MQRNKKVAFLVDGSFYPIRNGTDYSIDTLMNALSEQDKASPCLLLNWRGWDNPRLYVRQPFETIFMPSEHFYNDDGVVGYALSMRNIDYLHIYNAEEAIIFSKYIRDAGTKIIYEAINIDHVLYSALGADKAETEQSKRQQKQAMEEADFVLCRSSVDETHILDMGISERKVSVYRGAIDTDAIPFYERRRQHINIVFLGHMYYPPNENALERIVQSILPNLDRAYKFTVIGSTPDTIMSKYSDRGVVFKNGVDDLGVELKNYDIAIAPLLEGSGTRLKLLDYLASGIPTIGTTLSIEGLEESIRQSMIIEDSIDKYTEAIQRLTRDEELYEQLARSGRQYVEKYYDWRNNLKPFTDIYYSEDC